MASRDNESGRGESDAHRARVAACVSSQTTPDCGLVLVPMHQLSVVELSGADVYPFLQSKLTIDVRRWEQTGGGWGYALDINGRILFDAIFVRLNDSTIRMWSEPGMTRTIVNFLEHYIIMEDVSVRTFDPSEHWLIAAENTQTIDRIIGRSFARTWEYYSSENENVLAFGRSARPARLLDGAASAMRDALVHAGALYVQWSDWRDFEVAEGFVRTGIDLVRGQSIPLEAGENLGIDYNKGCYLGQEIIERLRSRGTPSREYRRVRWRGGVQEATPDLVDERGRNAGEITSWVGREDASVGIASIRRRALQEPSRLHCGSTQGPEVEIVGRVR